MNATPEVRKELDDRLLADYDVAFVPERERVEQRCAEAGDFIEAVCRHIDHESSS